MTAPDDPPSTGPSGRNAPGLTNFELLRQRQMLLFTNRERELRVLSESSQRTSPVRLIHFCGIAGVGKSTVITAAEQFCRQRRLVHARVNLGGNQTPESVLSTIFAQFCESEALLGAGSTFRRGRFALELDRLESVRQAVETASAASKATRALAAGYYDPVREGESTIVAERVLAEVAKLVGREDAHFLFNPGSVLTAALVDDVERSDDSDGRVCVFLDQYDQTGASLDWWVRESLFPNLRSSLLVLAGRGRLRPAWIQWRALVREIEVVPLSPDDTRRLVEKAALDDPALVSAIADLAAGLPLAAGLAIDLVNETGGRLQLGSIHGREIVEQLVEVFLADVPPELVDWVQRGAVARSFNEDILRQLSADPAADTRAVFEHLARLSITQRHDRGLAIHDAVRAFLNRELRIRAPSRYSDLNRRAHEYYSLLAGSIASVDERREVQVEQLYHQIRFDPEAGLVSLRELIEGATLLSQLEFSESLLSLAEQTPWTDEQSLWVRYLEALVRQQRNSDNRGSAEILTAILADPQCTRPELRVRAAAYLAMDMWYLGDFRAALHWSEHAIEAGDGVDRAFSFRHVAVEANALTLDRMGRFADGIAVQKELLDSARSAGDSVSVAWGLNNLGFFMWHLGAWAEALDHLDASQAAFRELQHPYGETYPLCHLGLVHLACSNHDKAREMLDRTLALCRERDNREIEAKVLENLSDYYIAVGEPETALTMADEAIAVAEAFDLPYFGCDGRRRRAEAHLARGWLDAAMTDFVDAGVLAEEMGAHYTELRCLLGRARVERASAGAVSSEVRYKLLEAIRDVRPGYGEVRSQVAVFCAELALSDARRSEAVALFESALMAALSFNVVVLETCADRIIDVCIRSDAGDVLDSVRHEWSAALALPSTVPLLARAQTLVRGLYSARDAPVVLHHRANDG